MPSPVPAHILRTHSAQLNNLYFSHENNTLYSGDMSGHVVITSMRSLRPLASWKAHNDGILGIQEWDGCFITQGRDNKLHIWLRIVEPAAVAETAATPSLPVPILKYSMDVNALNYCRFSLLLHSEGGSNTPEALIALPNLVDSSLADIWNVSSIDRIHAAIGDNVGLLNPGDGRGKSKTGIIMSLHLFRTDSKQLRILIAYENGSVALFAYTETTGRSVQGKGWEKLWTVKLHVESIMAMAVKTDNSAAFTVSADHMLCRYDLMETTAVPIVHRTNHPGNGALAVSDDGRIVAVGGWDGKVRLYSTRTFKALGTLSYHKEGCYAAAFAHSCTSDGIEYVDEEDSGGCLASKYLATSGKDCRIALWQLKDFEKKMHKK